MPALFSSMPFGDAFHLTAKGAESGWVSRVVTTWVGIESSRQEPVILADASPGMKIGEPVRSLQEEVHYPA